jgi:hypothetical protein
MRPELPVYGPGYIRISYGNSKYFSFVKWTESADNWEVCSLRGIWTRGGLASKVAGHQTLN